MVGGNLAHEFGSHLGAAGPGAVCFEQPPLHSVGDTDAGGDEIEFARGDSTFGFCLRCLVTHGAVLQAAREFWYFDIGTLPTGIAWEAEPSPTIGNTSELVT